MSIVIRPISDQSLRVGNKVVYRDQDGNWVAVTELTTAETEALSNFLSARDGRSDE